jgi:hypothetical protein
MSEKALEGDGPPPFLALTCGGSKLRQPRRSPIQLGLPRLVVLAGDRTAHQLRLQALLRQLGDEFCDTREAEDIRRCADAVLSRFADAPVRSYVQTLAYRQTRDCLRRESCDVLAVT